MEQLTLEKSGKANPQADQTTKNAEPITQSLNDKLKALAQEKPKEGEPVVFEAYRYGSDVPIATDIRNFLKPEVDTKLFLQIYDYRWVRSDEHGKSQARKLIRVHKDGEMAQWFKKECFRVQDGFVGIGVDPRDKYGEVPDLSLYIRSRYEGDEEARQARSFSLRRNLGVGSTKDAEASVEDVDKMNKTIQSSIPGDKSRVVDASRRYIQSNPTRAANVQQPLPKPS